MIPVYQNNQTDCLTGAICSILEKKIHEVPDFWSLERYYDLDICGFWTIVESWLNKNGYDLILAYPHQIDINNYLKYFDYHIMCFTSAISQSVHAIVAYKGEKIFDPLKDYNNKFTYLNYYIFINKRK